MTKFQEIEFKVNQTYKQLKNFKGFSGEYSVYSDQIRALMNVMVAENINLTQELYKLQHRIQALENNK